VLAHQHGPDLVVGQVARSEAGRRLDPPLSLHAQMGVDGQARVEAVQQMLASRDDFGGGRPYEVKVDQRTPA